MREWLSHYLLLPIGLTISGINYNKVQQYRNLLQKSEFDDFEIRREFINQRFRDLIQHCYDQVPFYRSYMDSKGLKVNDFHTIADVVKLPILEKQIVNQNFDSLLAENYRPGDFRFDYTGGSTGTPTKFGIDKKSYYKVYANAWRFWGYAGYQPGMKILLFWGNRIELTTFKRIRHKIRSVIENSITLNSYDFNDKDQIWRYVRYIQNVKPPILRGYAGAIYLFVVYCKKFHVKFEYPPQAVILTSEKIFPSQKMEIAQFFNTEVFDEYGSTEFGIIAHECHSHTGLHLAEERLIIETYNAEHQTSNFYGKGEFLITTLDNYAMPLMRYRIQDEGFISNQICSCGRTLKLIENIDGRVMDYIVTKTEKLVHLIIFYNILSKIKGIKFFQIHQDEIGKIMISIIKDKSFDDKATTKIDMMFYDVFRDDLKFYIQFVDKLEVTSSGKYKIISSEVVSHYLSI